MYSAYAFTREVHPPASQLIQYSLISFRPLFSQKSVTRYASHDGQAIITGSARETLHSNWVSLLQVYTHIYGGDTANVEEADHVLFVVIDTESLATNTEFQQDQSIWDALLRNIQGVSH